MARDSEADEALLRQVLKYAQDRDWERAGSLARRALAEGLEHPLLLNVVATCIENEGRFADALPFLERAVAIAPQDLGARNALALCLQRLDRPAEALGHAEELLKDHPDIGFLHANKGNSLIALGLLERARASHLRAVELEPRNVAAMASLASIASHRGSHDEARNWSQRVLTLVPNFPDAVIALAAADLASGATTRAEMLIRHLLADQRVVPLDAARARGLLGDVLDACGRYEEAFVEYSTCNEILRKVHRRFEEGTGVLEYTRRLASEIDRLGIEGLTPRPQPDNGGRAADAGPLASGAAAVTAHDEATAAEHVFLLGFPRSGTTLLEVVLDGHPRVASLDEYELLSDAVHRYMGDTPDLAGLMRADQSDLQALRSAYWKRVREADVDVAGKLFVDKYPLNTLKLPLIAKLFPRAKILFVCRDPRDVVLGCFRRRFRMNAAMFELLTLNGTAAFYEATMTLGQRLRPLFGSRWREVGYEALMADFEGELRSLCDFLGLDWVPGLDDFAARARKRERTTPSTAQLAAGITQAGTGHWRHYARQLEPVQPALIPWLHLGCVLRQKKAGRSPPDEQQIESAFRTSR